MTDKEAAKQYAERDFIEMDAKGAYYFRHVRAMTAENLHDKSDIAAELGWRDMQIAAQAARIEQLTAENLALKNFIKDECYTRNRYAHELYDASISMPETPVTGAALREIQAQAVESAADWTGDWINQQGDVIENIREYAKQLRSGEVQL